LRVALGIRMGDTTPPAADADRQAVALLAASVHRNEGIAAFLENRSPRFSGR